MMLAALLAATAQPCPPIEVAPRAMAIGTRYAAGDPSYSVVDPKRVAREQAARAPISRVVSRVAILADRYVASPADAKPFVANCLAKHLVAQARGEALMGAKSQYDSFYREWMIGSIALAYLKAADALRANDGADEVGAWLRASVNDIVAFNDAQLALGRIDNHRYWGALTAMAVGKAVQDPELMRAARRIRALGFSQVQADGTMPAESRRGRLSFHYHLFAAVPLAVLLTLDPEPAPQKERVAMQRLADRIIADSGRLSDGVIARAAGTGQLPEERPVLFLLLRPYVDQATRARVDELTTGVRRSYQFLGGDVSALLP